MSTEGLRGGTFGGGASIFGLSCIGSGLPVTCKFVTKPPPLGRTSSFSAMSDKKKDVAVFLVGVETISHGSVVNEDEEIFLVFVPDLDDFIPGDFSEFSLFLG